MPQGDRCAPKPTTKMFNMRDDGLLLPDPVGTAALKLLVP
jgi:hypothetical protein